MAFTGQSAEEMLGDGWTSAVHPDDRARAALEWREAVARAAPYEAEVRIRRHDGEWRWMSVTAAPIRDASGGVVEWFGMNIDITEQKNAANALRESEERFRLFMDNSPAFAWVKDEEGRYVYVSQTYERRFGLEAADRLGKTDAELWPPGVAQGFKRTIWWRSRPAALWRSSRKRATPTARKLPGSSPNFLSATQPESDMSAG